MKNGFIYPIFDFLIQTINRFSIVEYLKDFSAWTYRKIKAKELQELETIAAKNFAIDVFIVLKWMVVVGLLAFDNNSAIALYAVCYLIFFNFFTYFYYHSWGGGFVQKQDRIPQRRRFLNFLLSIAFYIFCYAYLYHVHFQLAIKWPSATPDAFDAIYLSVANAFTLTYGDFSPKTQLVRFVFLTELINTFFFFTVIVVNSIPNIQKEN